MPVLFEARCLTGPVVIRSVGKRCKSTKSAQLPDELLDLGRSALLSSVRSYNVAWASDVRIDNEKEMGREGEIEK